MTVSGRCTVTPFRNHRAGDDSLAMRKMVPGEGVEPSHPCGRQILSLLRLPFRHPGGMERVKGIEPS